MNNKVSFSFLNYSHKRTTSKKFKSQKRSKWLSNQSFETMASPMELDLNYCSKIQSYYHQKGSLLKNNSLLSPRITQFKHEISNHQQLNSFEKLNDQDISQNINEICNDNRKINDLNMFLGINFIKNLEESSKVRKKQREQSQHRQKETILKRRLKYLIKVNKSKQFLFANQSYYQQKMLDVQKQIINIQKLNQEQQGEIKKRKSTLKRNKLKIYKMNQLRKQKIRTNNFKHKKIIQNIKSIVQQKRCFQIKQRYRLKQLQKRTNKSISRIRKKSIERSCNASTKNTRKHFAFPHAQYKQNPKKTLEKKKRQRSQRIRKRSRKNSNSRTQFQTKVDKVKKRNTRCNSNPIKNFLEKLRQTKKKFNKHLEITLIKSQKKQRK